MHSCQHQAVSRSSAAERHVSEQRASMDIFTPVVPEEEFHPNFKAILLDELVEKRAELSRWADGFPDRDGKFVREFQTTFNSCFWEIYLFATLKEYGCSFDWSQQSPDFTINKDGGHFSVEAVTANSAQGKPSEWMRTAETFKTKPDLNALNREAIIRLSNAVHSKAKRYEEHYAKLPHVTRKPFVLAIAPFEQPLFNLQYNRPIKALLYDHYIDEQEYLENPSKYPYGPPEKHLGFIEKDNGAEIELGIFNDSRFEEVSAVLFSCTATWGKIDVMCEGKDSKMIVNSVWGSEPYGAPVRRTGIQAEYSETLTDGLQVYHNPFAKYPLRPEVFRREGVVQAYFDFDTDTWVEEEVNRSLFWRQVFNLVPR